MCFTIICFLICWIVGAIAVASNPSPFFGAFGLVVVAGVGCGILVEYGSSFLALILFLIYLGGMLVVFAYSAALAAEPYPESWLNSTVVVYMCCYAVAVMVGVSVFWHGWVGVFSGSADEWGPFGVFRADNGGVAVMYSEGGWMLIVGAGVLLLTLFVVLELTRGLSRGTLRAV
ncbi:NADH dehydrogenase subunit 6 (mitochondrion) [Epinephelus lanceolatus]|uniref:NADH-ubiquinone oxidoreductase chain 6 n=3 Tax=Epinephelus TaxID=94231 RepID=B8Y3X8_EPILA|nr:NADH dehydrogenase subunit 6 [Epinephelus lanceolatus]QBY39991.1 NADH dehydrogenase subunit 6 [Epinephelus akaara x Epinephelus lanceolatus]QBY40004.1 NADH dehydrogenase subunit 6 [Epinephelus moara x Epinephelus lanceolatus]ACJ69598.1 NADH dehydrogenase subunit 6 [Epinephelus lanceolatus]ADY85989.1 NADH dehydrogenase subunit 6 [Epinephelus lanceolatus]AHW99469.1 NADH dehydrogenase subunit 6 [Epinephelus lanceolatus]